MGSLGIELEQEGACQLVEVHSNKVAHDALENKNKTGDTRGGGSRDQNHSA